jgi:hypothetical protein
MKDEGRTLRQRAPGLHPCVVLQRELRKPLSCGYITDVTEKHYREVAPAEVSAAMSRVSSLLPNLAPPVDEGAD